MVASTLVQDKCMAISVPRSSESQPDVPNYKSEQNRGCFEKGRGGDVLGISGYDP
jgi:hypothetical protein